MERRQAAVDEYCGWLQENGASVSGIALQVTKDYGTIAIIKEDISPLFSLPSHLVLSVSALKDTVEFKHVKSALDQDCGAAIMLCWLMRRKFFRNEGEVTPDASDKWMPYIDQMPLTYGDAFQWTDKELALLKGTNLLSSISAVKGRLRQLYDVVVGGVRKLHPEHWQGATWERWLWAHSTFISRSFPVHASERGIIINTDDSTHADLISHTCDSLPCMLPLFDALNHNRDGGTWAYDSSLDALVFSSHTQLQVGDEVHLSYGEKFDEDLLLCYGFVGGFASFPVKLAGGLRYILTPKNPVPQQVTVALANMMGADEEDFGDEDLQDEVRSILEQMLVPRLVALEENVDETVVENRERVKMAEIYRLGQRDTVRAALRFIRDPLSEIFPRQ